MIRFSASLVVIAMGLLVAGGVTSKLLLVYVAIALSAAALCGIGLLTSLFNGRSAWFSAARQTVFGCAAAAITCGLGSMLGVSLS